MNKFYKYITLVVFILFFQILTCVSLNATTLYEKLVNYDEEVQGLNQDLYPKSITLYSYIPYVGKEEVTYTDFDTIKQIIDILKKCTCESNGENIYGEQLGNELRITACFDNIICYDPFAENHLVTFDNVERKVCLALSNKRKCMYLSYRRGVIGNEGDIDDTILSLANFFTNENIKNNFEYDLNTMEEKKQIYIEAINTPKNNDIIVNIENAEASSKAKVLTNTPNETENNDNNTQVVNEENKNSNTNIKTRNNIYTLILIIILISFILIILLINKIKKGK